MIWDGLRLILVLAVLHALLCLFVLQESTLTQNFTRERIAQHALMSDPAANFAETRATNLFTQIAVNTGAMANSFSGTNITPPTPVSTPSPQGGGGLTLAATPATKPAAGATAFSNRVSGWLQERVRVLWTVAYFTLVRLSYALLWWPFLVLGLGPSMVDAIAARKVAATTFALTSPQLQGMAMRLMPLLMASYFLFVFLPFYEPPMTVPIGIVVTCGLVWLGVAQFAKRG